VIAAALINKNHFRSACKKHI